MKRFIAVLSGLLVLPAFAEVAPIYFDEDIQYGQEDFADGEDVIVDEDTTIVNTPTPATTTAARTTTATGRTASRALPAGTTTTTSKRAVASRGVTTRTAAATTTARTASSNVVARPSTTNAATTQSRATVARAATTNTTAKNSATQNVTARRATNTGATTARASITQTDTVSTPLYTGRVGVRTSASTTASRLSTTGASTGLSNAATVTTAVADVATTTSTMDQMAQLTDYCKAQYTQCMDNFCNRLDDNQGRCSCSANLKNYAKTEEALKNVTSALQDAAVKINYISKGMSDADIEAMFKQAEAEITLQNTTDTSQIKGDLDKLKDMIGNVKAGSGTVSSTISNAFDFSNITNLSLDGMGFDFSNLFGSNTTSINNQRGEELYKTAAARCKASVLNTCSAQGVDVNLITNAYDLEIDKQCLAYERSLSDANDQMTRTVSNANILLQLARLSVRQSQNEYDLRGCVNALDTCMQDEFVCGDKYKGCLDPSGKYIVNGKIVSGSAPGVSGGDLSDADAAANDGLYATWDYDTTNAWAKNGTVSDYIKAYVKSTLPKADDKIAVFLQKKIGFIDSNGDAQGMCMSVLDKCQDLTYTGTTNNKVYNPENDVVKEYLQRTLIQIKNSQDEILADYAETCTSDVLTCLNKNNTTYGYGYTTYNYTTNGNPSMASIRACASVINTCRSVTEDTANRAASDEEWLDRALGTTIVSGRTACTYDVGSWNDALNTCVCRTGTWDYKTLKCTDK